jgi:hypothetical protein
MDTGGITPDTIKALQSGYKTPNLFGMIGDIGRGGLSNLESLVRGGVAQVPGTAGDLETLARMGLNASFGAGGVKVSPKAALPTTTDILGIMPQRVTQARPESAGMEELGTMMAPGLAKAAAPVGKSYLSLLGNEINAGMTGQPTRSVVGQMTPKPLQLDVYHGTPHSFERFDASKIGTGEGAQAYGHGIYVAENPEVARGYANRLGANLIMVDGKPMDFNDPVHIAASIISDPNNAGLPGERLASAIRYDPKGIVPFGAESKVEEIAKALESGNLPKFTNQKGNFYKADLPDEMIPKMLDWDKPLSQQPDILEILKKNYRSDYLDMFKNKPGSDFYKAISGNEGTEDLRVLGSSELKNMGIPGIKYLDEGSRRPGVTSMTQAQLDTRIDILKKDIDSGLGNQDRMKQILSALEAERASHSNLTRNFVVFPGEEQNIKILERNAEKTTK